MENANTWAMKATLIISIVLIYLLTYFILRGSTKLVPLIGETGNKVMMRLMGLILMVIALECFIGGIKPVLVEVIRLGNGLPAADQSNISINRIICADK